MNTTPTTPDIPDSTVAITGAGSGLGRELALQLAGKGYRVYGTQLPSEDVDDLLKTGGGRISLTSVDITNADAVEAWAEEVGAEIGTRGLDLLINNAGILTPGPLETVPLDAIRREFEVNVFAGIAVTNAFLPALRTAPGRVVFIGAMTGRFPLPFNGPSSITKAALEAVADVYRAELNPFDIPVIVAQAGNMATGGPAKTAAGLKKATEALTKEQRALYGDAFATFVDALNAMQSSGLSADKSAARVIELAEQVPAPARGPVGEDATEILRLVKEKSDAELDALRLKLVGLGGK